jgi:hypothetical protein
MPEESSYGLTRLPLGVDHAGQVSSRIGQDRSPGLVPVLSWSGLIERRSRQIQTTESLPLAIRLARRRLELNPEYETALPSGCRLEVLAG